MIDGKCHAVVDDRITQLDEPITKAGMTYTHRIGNVGLTADEHDVIATAMAALPADPRAGRPRIGGDEHGPCPKCGTWCEGDCVASR